MSKSKNISKKKKTFSSKKTKNNSESWLTGSKRPVGRPKKQRVFVNNDSLEADFENLPRSEGGGSAIAIRDQDSFYSQSILGKTSSHLESLEVNEDSGITEIKLEPKYSHKDQALYISTIPTDKQLVAKVKREEKLKKDIETKSQAEVTKEYSLAEMRSLGDTYNVKWKGEGKEKPYLYRNLKSKFAEEPKTQSFDIPSSKVEDISQEYYKYESVNGYEFSLPKNWAVQTKTEVELTDQFKFEKGEKAGKIQDEFIVTLNNPDFKNAKEREGYLIKDTPEVKERTFDLAEKSIEDYYKAVRISKDEYKIKQIEFEGQTDSTVKIFVVTETGY